MPRIYPLFSSSKGNCIYIGTLSEGVLIDCGVSFVRTKSAFERSGLSFSAVKGIFITHEHHDHVSGLKMITRKTGIPVFAQSLTLDILYDSGQICSAAEDIKAFADIGLMTVNCFETSHDTKESCGYRVDFADGTSCAVCTDLGYVSDTVRSALKGCGTVLLEANYDEQKLRYGAYPAYLKERIRSKVGHLSNKDCGEFAAELVKNGTTRIILGHLSQENNTPELAEYTVESIIAESGFQRGRDYFLSCAAPETDGGFIAF